MRVCASTPLCESLRLVRPCVRVCALAHPLPLSLHHSLCASVCMRGNVCVCVCVCVCCVCARGACMETLSVDTTLDSQSRTNTAESETQNLCSRRLVPLVLSGILSTGQTLLQVAQVEYIVGLGVKGLGVWGFGFRPPQSDGS